MNKKLTWSRIIVAIISTGAEEFAIWAVWYWLLPGFGIEPNTGILIGVMVGWGAFSIALFIFTTYTLNRQSTVGLPSMVGATGTAVGRLAPEGMVKIRGELWKAAAEDGEIKAGEEILVMGEKGLKLLVRRAGEAKR